MEMDTSKLQKKMEGKCGERKMKRYDGVKEKVLRVDNFYRANVQSLHDRGVSSIQIIFII